MVQAPSAWAGTHHPEVIMKILLAVDGSHVTKRMLAYIAAHDERMQAGTTFAVLTVVLPLSRFAGPALGRATLDTHYKEEAEAVLQPIRAFAKQQGWQVTFEHVVGQPAEAIAAAAISQPFDMVVMGTHGHSSLANVVMGSVATGVLARCKVPVLLIR
jgi:nucleotide-binding universal stress UspA family protein